MSFRVLLLPSGAVVIPIRPAWKTQQSETQAEFSLTAELQRCDAQWVETTEAPSKAGVKSDVVKSCCHSFLCVVNQLFSRVESHFFAFTDEVLINIYISNF